MPDIEFRVETPAWLWALIPVLGVIAVIWLTGDRRTRFTGKTVAAAVMSAVTAVLLVLYGAGLSLSTETDKQSTVILLDLSDSTEDVRADVALYGEALLDSLDEDDVTGVLAFGGGTVYFPGRSFSADSPKLKKLKTDSTDIASAMKQAVGLMDKYRHKRIILISDGRETSGDAAYTAAQLAGRQVRIDTIYVNSDVTPDREAQVNGVFAEGGGFAGSEICLHVRMQSSTATGGVLTVTDGERELLRQDVTLGIRESTVDLRFVEEQSGLHAYRVTLTAEQDTDTRNNEGYAAVQICERPAVLIVAADTKKAEPLRALLAEAADVTVVSESEAPASMPALCRYDCLYVMNADAGRLPENFGDMLESAVQTYGKHVCFIGGDSTFSHGGMDDTVYETMQPVDFGAFANDLAVVLVLDHSGSMHNRNNYMELAKTGAIKMLDSLPDGASVGVISFNHEVDEIAPLTALNADSRASIRSAIGSILPTGGTSYSPALSRVQKMLTGCDAQQKYVIFLTDGYPEDYGNGIITKVTSLKKRGVILNTIGIMSGSGMESGMTGILERMAKEGGGTASYVRNALELPQVMLNEAIGISTEYAFLEPFVPSVALRDELTEGLSHLPSIGGYVGVHKKENAQVYLTSESGDPIYAVRTLGGGCVSTFASDLSDVWCREWLADEAVRAFMLNAMKAALPGIRYDSSVKPTVTTDGFRAVVRVELPFGNDESDLTVSIDGPDKQTLYPERVSKTVYRTEAMLTQPGEYRVTVVLRQRGREIDRTETVFAIAYSGEYDAFRPGDEALLSTVSSSAGGVLTNDVSALAAEDSGILHTRIPLGTVLCVLAVLLFLSGIVVRKFTAADFRRLFGKRAIS